MHLANLFRQSWQILHLQKYIVLHLLDVTQAAMEMGNLQQRQRDSAAYQAAIAARAATGAAAANLRKRCNQCEACLTSQVTLPSLCASLFCTLVTAVLHSVHRSSALPDTAVFHFVHRPCSLDRPLFLTLCTSLLHCGHCSFLCCTCLLFTLYTTHNVPTEADLFCNVQFE